MSAPVTKNAWKREEGEGGGEGEVPLLLINTRWPVRWYSDTNLTARVI